MARSIKLLFIFIVFSSMTFSSFAQDESAKIKQLVKGADVIVSGKVKEKKSSWNEKKTRIYTRTTVEVDEYLKGQRTGKSIEIKTLGGEVGDVGEVYTHMPTFDKDEEVLLFLEKNEPEEVFQVFHGEEGKINMHKNTQTGENNSKADMQLKDLKKQIRKYMDQK
jgi:hypothetical protein